MGEFGKRGPGSPQRPAAEPAPARTPRSQPAGDPAHMRKAVLAIGLTILVVGGMFLLPSLGQCDGRKGFLGLDWCRLMKASVEGGARGVAIGRGTTGSR